MKSQWLTGLLLCLAVAGHARENLPARAPSFELPGRTGTVSSDSLRGKVVYVDFWASWCEPCRKSFPWLASLHEKYASQGLAIVAVNLDKSSKAAAAFLEKFPAPFTVAYDPKGRTAEAYGVSAMPSSFLVGRDGTLLLSHAGFDPKNAEQLEQRVKEACAQ